MRVVITDILLLAVIIIIGYVFFKNSSKAKKFYFGQGEENTVEVRDKNDEEKKII